MAARTMIGPVSKAVGANVDRIRKARGISVLALSIRVGVHRLAITAMMHGRRRVDVDELVALAAVLGVEVEQLCGLGAEELVVVPAVTVSLASPEVEA